MKLYASLLLSMLVALITYGQNPKVGRVPKKTSAKRITVSSVAMVGDGITNNNAALLALINSTANEVYVPPGVYLISGPLSVYGLKGKRIVFAKDAKILNTTTTMSFLFQNFQNIEITGGKFGLRTPPTENGGAGQHVFQFDRGQGLLVNHIEILNSAEMGIAVTNSNNIVIKENNIHNTFRDGVYFRYSANVKVLRNRLDNIKDDAISFHDKDNLNIGVDAEKSVLASYGYMQSTNAIIEGNTITNAYQGIGSISAANVKIQNNKIRRTVIAGIAIFNMKNDNPHLVKGVVISGNTLDSTNQGATINGKFYPNYGQSGTGRAAISAVSLGTNNQLNQGETKRLLNIRITQNRIVNSGASSIRASKVDGLVLTGNTIKNGAGYNSKNSLSGIQVELDEIRGIYRNNNIITNSRN